MRLIYRPVFALSGDPVAYPAFADLTPVDLIFAYPAFADLTFAILTFVGNNLRRGLLPVLRN
jgi:hypothetical protein